MYLAFCNSETSQYVKHFRTAATYIHDVEYTDDIQEAALYRKEYYEKLEPGSNESWMAERIRIFNQRKGVKIEPVQVMLLEVKEDTHVRT